MFYQGKRLHICLAEGRHEMPILIISEQTYLSTNPAFLFLYIYKYSRTSLSQTRLFRITAYFEMKIWSLFHHETMTTGNKIMWKRGEIAP